MSATPTLEDRIVDFLRAAERAGFITRRERLLREGPLLLASMRKGGLIPPARKERQR